MSHRAGGTGSGVGCDLPIGNTAIPGRTPDFPGAHGRGGRRSPRRSRQDGGGACHSVAGRPEWPLPADRGRHLSRSGSAAGTSPTHRTSPGGGRGADRLAALGSPRIIRRNVAKRLVAAVGLPDSGGGPRSGDLRVRGLARPESRGVPGQSPRNSADCLPAGEAGQPTAFPHGDKPASAPRSLRWGDLPAPGRPDGYPACRLDHRTGRPCMGDASSPFHPGCAGASYDPARPRRPAITARHGNSPASAGG